MRTQRLGQQLDQERAQLALQFEATHPTRSADPSGRCEQRFANRPFRGADQLTYAQASERIIQRGENGPFPARQITSDRPPQPYVDLRRAAILKRVLNKEVLRQAFVGLGLFVGDGGDNVHGEFGDAANLGPTTAQQNRDRDRR